MAIVDKTQVGQPVPAAPQLPSQYPEVPKKLSTSFPDFQRYHEEQEALYRRLRESIRTGYDELKFPLQEVKAATSKNTQTIIRISSGGGIDLSSVYAAISSEAQTRTDRDTALADLLTTLETNTGNSLSTINSELGTLANADTALAQSVQTLSSQVNNATTGLPATLARVGTIETTYATQTFAEAKKSEAIYAAATDATAKADAAQSNAQAFATSAVNTEATARASADSTNASAISALSSQVNNATTGLPATLARVGTIETTYATQAFAEAKKSEAIYAAATDATAKANTAQSNAETFASATVNTESTARATADGFLAGKHVLAVTAGNVVTGMEITSSSATNGGTVSEVAFQADRFKIHNGSTGQTPFLVSGGNVYMDQAIINNVSANAIQAGDLTVVNIAHTGKLYNPAYPANKFAAIEPNSVQTTHNYGYILTAWGFTHKSNFKFQGPGGTLPGVRRFAVSPTGVAQFLIWGFIGDCVHSTRTIAYQGPVTVYVRKNGSGSYMPIYSGEHSVPAKFSAYLYMQGVAQTDYMDFYIAPCNGVTGILNSIESSADVYYELTILCLNPPAPV